MTTQNSSPDYHIHLSSNHDADFDEPSLLRMRYRWCISLPCNPRDVYFLADAWRMCCGWVFGQPCSNQGRRISRKPTWFKSMNCNKRARWERFYKVMPVCFSDVVSEPAKMRAFILIFCLQSGTGWTWLHLIFLPFSNAPIVCLYPYPPALFLVGPLEFMVGSWQCQISFEVK